MPTIKIRGVKTYRSKGRLYHYHRATGLRIEVDLEASPQLFLARVQELDAMGNMVPSPKEQSVRLQTLGAMLDAWRQSEEWKGLKPQTKCSYERVI